MRSLSVNSAIYSKRKRYIFSSMDFIYQFGVLNRLFQLKLVKKRTFKKRYL